MHAACTHTFKLELSKDTSKHYSVSYLVNIKNIVVSATVTFRVPFWGLVTVDHIKASVCFRRVAVQYDAVHSNNS